MTDNNFQQERHDFSLVLGGPVFQLLQKSHLSGSDLELLHRRLLVITLVAWLPCCFSPALALYWGGVGWLSFLRDFEMRIRLLIALPSLVAAELIVHSLLRFVVHCFVKRHIVSPDNLPGFDSAIEFATWYAMPGGRWHLTPAGLLICVCQHPHLSVLSPALIHENPHLVSFSMAGVQNQFEPYSHSSRSLCRSGLSGQKCLCLRPNPLRSGCDARRGDSQSHPL
jgi:hypothetical protein